MYVVNNICSVVCVQANRLDTEKFHFHEAMMGRIIEREFRIAINGGVTQFRIGMNMGADIWAARRLIWRRRPHCRGLRWLPPIGHPARPAGSACAAGTAESGTLSKPQTADLFG